ncbi:MAG TPA: CoA transferase [Caulobacteraceae bacterium]|nr:CoA transferase [Caulobacteraceae bacterium]
MEPGLGASAGPLAGIAVAELSGEVATRYVGRLFAQLGATVVRVADAGGEPLATPLFAAWLDEGKRLVGAPAEALAALDGAEKPLAIAGQGKAAVVAAEALLAGRDIPLLALSWFDPRGCYGDWRGNDPLIQAMTGIAFGFGPVDGPPTIPQGHAPQLVGGITAFVGALAALFLDAPPRRIESSVFEAALCFTETGAVGAVAYGWESKRLGVNRFSPSWPCSLYRARDGWVGVTALTYAQWAAFARLMGRPELAAEPRFMTTLQRLAAGDEVNAIVAEAVAKRPVAFWVENGDALRIPITPAALPRELPYQPHWRDRGAFAALADGVQGPTSPFRFRFQGERRQRPRGGPAGPLQGVRVADFSMGWAGPLGARLLADLGADVLKIESGDHRDWWRGWDPHPESDPPLYELPRNFMAVNRNKRGLNLDLGQPEDHAAASAIVALADVVIDNQGPGVMEKLGLAAPDQRRLNPGVVSVFMPPFGATGPLAGLRAYGSTVEQASGMPFVNGRDEWPPAMQHVAYGDPVAGLYAAAAALVGLYGRERLGGAAIELCQVECLFQLGVEGLIAEQAQGAALARTGSRRRDMAPCCVVAADGVDRWLAVAVDSDPAWPALARIIGRADLADDAALTTLAGRKARETEIAAAISAWAQGRDAREAAEALQAAGVPAAPVIPTHELFPDPHLQDCGYWALQFRRYIDDHFTPNAPLRFDGERLPVIRPAPTLGEHTEEVLAELGILRSPPP